MDIEFEGRVWKTAAQVFGVGLQNLVEEGIVSFKRRPGLDDPTRIHASLIGAPAFEALQGAARRSRGTWPRRERLERQRLYRRSIASQNASEASSAMAAHANVSLER